MGDVRVAHCCRHITYVSILSDNVVALPIVRDLLVRHVFSHFYPVTAEIHVCTEFILSRICVFSLPLFLRISTVVIYRPDKLQVRYLCAAYTSISDDCFKRFRTTRRQPSSMLFSPLRCYM